MSGFNRIILMGNLTRDPELRSTPQGTSVSDLRLAVTTVRGGRGPERKEETIFIDCTVWDKLAETCSEYLKKGRPVLVEGRLVEDSWQDKETGEKRSRFKVMVQTLQFIGNREGGGRESGRFTASSESARRQSSPPTQQRSSGSSSSRSSSGGYDDAFDAPPPSPADDIPF
jgi:single-strand DNA-binding protein